MTANQTSGAPSRSWLVGQGGRFAGQRFQLSRPSILIGRGSDCDLVFDDPQVSRHHARLTWEAGHWFVQDLGSTNGTQVNGIRVTERRYFLNPGGLLSLGSITFKLQTGDLEDTMVARHPVPPPVSAPYPPQPPPVPVGPGTSSWMSAGTFMVLGLILLLVVGVVVWLLLSPALGGAGPPQVNIDTPANGTQVAEGDILMIIASATHRKNLSRLEIWVDNELAQSAPGTTSALVVNYPWTAQGPGSHVVLARAYDAAGQSSDALITVAVTAGTSASSSPTPGQPVATPSATGEAIPPSTSTPTPGTSATDIAAPTHTTPPTDTPQATDTPIPQPAPLGVFNDFETPTTWTRGDQPNGTFERSDGRAHNGSYAGRLAYNFPGGGNDFVVFLWNRALDGDPNRINAWVHGDGSDHYLNVWIKDNGGQTWQFTFGQVGHTGWQQMSAYLDTGQPWPAGHIAGPDNGRVDYPISFQALVLDDVPDSYSGSGAIYVDDLESLRGGGLPTPTPTPTSPPPTPSGPATIDFRADDTSLDAGDCTTLRWDVENVREVYLNGGGVTGHGSREVCPAAATTYTLHVVLADGSTSDRTITIVVSGESGGPPPAPSNLTIAISMSNGFGLSFTDNSGGSADGFRLYNADTISLMREYPASAAPNLPISGLNCETTYRLALTAFNKFGESGPSNIVQGTTQPCE